VLANGIPDQGLRHRESATLPIICNLPGRVEGRETKKRLCIPQNFMRALIVPSPKDLHEDLENKFTMSKKTPRPYASEDDCGVEHGQQISDDHNANAVQRPLLSPDSKPRRSQKTCMLLAPRFTDHMIL